MVTLWVMVMVAWTIIALSWQILKRCALVKWLECIGNGKATRAPYRDGSPPYLSTCRGEHHTAPHCFTLYHTLPNSKPHSMPHSMPQNVRLNNWQGTTGAPLPQPTTLEGTCIPHKFNLHLLIPNFNPTQLRNYTQHLCQRLLSQRISGAVKNCRQAPRVVKYIKGL